MPKINKLVAKNLDSPTDKALQQNKLRATTRQVFKKKSLLKQNNKDSSPQQNTLKKKIDKQQIQNENIASNRNVIGNNSNISMPETPNSIRKLRVRLHRTPSGSHCKENLKEKGGEFEDRAVNKSKNNVLSFTLIPENEVSISLDASTPSLISKCKVTNDKENMKFKQQECEQPAKNISKYSTIDLPKINKLVAKNLDSPTDQILQQTKLRATTRQVFKKKSLLKQNNKDSSPSQQNALKKKIDKQQIQNENIASKRNVIGNNSNISMPETPNCIRKLRVRLHRTPSGSHCKENTKEKGGEFEDRAINKSKNNVLCFTSIPENEVSISLDASTPSLISKCKANNDKENMKFKQQECEQPAKNISTIDLRPLQKNLRCHSAFTSTPIAGKHLFPIPELNEEKRKALKKLSLNIRESPLKLTGNNNSDISLFNPHRHSTFQNVKTHLNELEKSFENEKNKGTASGDEGNKSNKSLEKSNKSLTNKSHLIEEILNSLDEDAIEKENVPDDFDDSLQANVKDSNKTNKFFHREEKSIPKYRRKIASLAQSRKSHIYDYLSQSQTSDSDPEKLKDPTADVAQKLVEAGKAVLVSRRKGKNIVKRNVCRKTKKTIQKAKNIIAKTAPGGQIKKTNLKKKVTFHNIDDDNDSADNFLPLPPPSPIPEFDESDSNVQAHFNDIQEASSEMQTNGAGSFSKMARSVLLQETQKKRVSDRHKLLEAARKIVNGSFVSQVQTTASPLSKGGLQTTTLSPISMSVNNSFNKSKSERIPNRSKERLTNLSHASPWRVGNESFLPSVFHFSRDSHNLPSYSSDYIPASPRKPKPYVNKFASLGRTSPLRDLDDNPVADVASKHSSLTSSIDSNAENQPPSNEPQQQNISQQNEDIFNARHLPNPRRTLPNRSPLKPINIQEVVILPSWKNIVPPANNLSENTNALKPSSKKRTLDSNTSKSEEELFGFEDYIGEDENLPRPSTRASKSKSNSSGNPKKIIREKLSALRKWRPNDIDFNKVNSNKITKNVFDDNVAMKKQRQINEMLCSTMINPTSVDQATNSRRSSVDSEPFRLFEDPEVTFDEEKPHRTYIKPKAKKRKVKRDFVLFLDSDLSEEEEEEEVKPNKPAEKKKRIDKKESAELNHFIKNFNKMCEEVDHYEIAMEKSS